MMLPIGIFIVTIALLAWICLHGLHEVERDERTAALIARADRQHAQVMAGDEKGVYGIYPPAV